MRRSAPPTWTDSATRGATATAGRESRPISTGPQRLRGRLGATLQEAPERATRLNNLGTGWSLRHACSGEPGDLDRAKAAYEAALAAMPAAAPQRAAALNNLGNGLLARYGD
jgi:hypothetical protein